MFKRERERGQERALCFSYEDYDIYFYFENLLKTSELPSLKKIKNYSS
jgi:hypothetical protein